MTGPKTGTVLLYGGTFDPPHRGHVEPCRAAADAIGAERVVYIPAAISPTKTDASAPASAEHRVAMLELALEDDQRTKVSRIELDRAGPSYFVDTVRAFRDELDPGTTLRFVIGADQALEFRRWRDWETILELATPVVLVRPPFDRAAFERALADAWGEDAARWSSWIIEAPHVDASATDVRDRFDRGDDITELLDPRVAAYADWHGLYRFGDRG